VICCAVCREPIEPSEYGWTLIARGEHIDDPRGDEHHRHAPEQVGPFAELSPPYSTIVVDPPWRYDDGATEGQRASGKRTFLPYSSMSVDEVAAMPVGALAKPDAHLWLWTTTRYLSSAYSVAASWGFTVGPVLTWCKPENGHPSGGTFANTSEFLLVCRHNWGPSIAAACTAVGMNAADLHRAVRGGRPTGLTSMWLKGERYPSDDDWEGIAAATGATFDLAGPLDGTVSTTWFQWPRGAHSAKPDAALDLIEWTSPAPRVELFARAPRLGWDSWGKGYEIGASA